MEVEIDEESLGVETIAEFIKAHDWSRYVKKQRRRSTEKVILWETTWGEMIRDESICDPDSPLSCLFRRRFRVPFIMFRDVLVPMCLDRQIFGRYVSKKIPIEFKILVSLRMLGRGQTRSYSVTGNTTHYLFVAHLITSHITHHTSHGHMVWHPSGC